MQKALLNTLKGAVQTTPPVWLMRQAGRYLPEYRALRAQKGSFLDMALDPEAAAEVTLQPLRRFHLDAAIIFADILLIPWAWRRGLTFVAGEGPRMIPLTDPGQVLDIPAETVVQALSPVFEALDRVKTQLSAETTLIGFAGGPWTVATYMLAGGADKDAFHTRCFARSAPDKFDALLDHLVEATLAYLSAQIHAGAECVQIFESHADSVPGDLTDRVLARPLRCLLQGLQEAHPDVPVILFARGQKLPEALSTLPGLSGIGVDHRMSRAEMRAQVAEPCALQGAVDPAALIAGGEALRRGVEQDRRAFAGRAHILNLGHGVTPDTPPEHVAQMVEWARAPLEEGVEV